jgi:hypothetical protein
MSNQLSHTYIRIVYIFDLHDLRLPSLSHQATFYLLRGDLTEGRLSCLLSRLEELSVLKSQFPHIFVGGGNRDRALDENCESHDNVIQ